MASVTVDRNDLEPSKKPWSQARLYFVYALVIGGLAWALFVSRFVVLISLLGIGIGVLVSPVFRTLSSRFRIPKFLSALLVLVLLAAIAGGAFFAIGFIASDQIQALAERAPELTENLKRIGTDVFSRYPWIESRVREFDFGSALRQGLAGIYQGIQSGFTLISGVIFAIIIGLYAGVGDREYYRGLVASFPPRLRPKADRFFTRSAEILRKWFRAQLLDMAIIGGLTAFGLWLTGVDYWAVFGLMTALLGIIPYVGVILVVFCATLITLASDPSNVPWVLGVFFLTQQIEGNVVLPIVMKGQVELPEVPLLIFMLFMGSWFGLFGVFLAPPIFAVLRVAYLELYLPAIEGRDHKGAASERQRPVERRPTFTSGHPIET